jgi:hypothetical protein
MLQSNCAEMEESLDIAAVAGVENEVVEQGGGCDVSAEDGVEANPMPGR